MSIWQFAMDTNWFQGALDRAGTNQADLARHLGLAPSAISRMLKGERQMKLLEAVQIASFLGVSQEDVLRHAGDGGVAAVRGEPARRAAAAISRCFSRTARSATRRGRPISAACAAPTRSTWSATRWSRATSRA